MTGSGKFDAPYTPRGCSDTRKIGSNTRRHRSAARVSERTSNGLSFPGQEQDVWEATAILKHGGLGNLSVLPHRAISASDSPRALGFLDCRR